MPNIDEIARQLAGNLTLEQLRERQGNVATRTRPDPTPEQIRVLQEYWQSVFAEKQAPSSQLFITRNLNQEMEYPEARRKFWNILQMRAAHISMLENNPDFEWQISEGMAAMLQNLVKYFINDKTSAYALNKGLFIFGANGTGKTEIMRAMSEFTCQNALTKQFVFCSMSEIYTEAKSNKEYDPIAPNVQQDRCFDEFARYTGPIIRFGDSLDINEAIIERRYDRFKRYGQITHFISNSTGNETENAISPMIFDRLRSICTSVLFEGKSKR